MKNFELAHRRVHLIPFGLLPEGTILDWIETHLGTAGAPYTEDPAGVQNSVNTSFTLSASGFIQHLIIKNRTVLTEEHGDYTLVGSTITFAEAPHADDTLLFWGWTA